MVCICQIIYSRREFAYICTAINNFDDMCRGTINVYQADLRCFSITYIKYILNRIGVYIVRRRKLLLLYGSNGLVAESDDFIVISSRCASAVFVGSRDINVTSRAYTNIAQSTI